MIQRAWQMRQQRQMMPPMRRFPMMQAPRGPRH